MIYAIHRFSPENRVKTTYKLNLAYMNKKQIVVSSQMLLHK